MVSLPRKAPALLVAIIAVWITIVNRKRSALRAIAKQINEKYGGEDALINKAELMKVIKDQNYMLPEGTSLESVFVANDDGDAKLNVEELSNIWSEILEQYFYAEPALSPRLLEDAIKIRWYEYVLGAVAVCVFLYICFRILQIYDFIQVHAGWHRFANIVRRSSVVESSSPYVRRIIQEGVDLKAGLKAEVIMDADAKRVFRMLKQLDKGGTTDDSIKRASVWECEEIGSRKKKFVVKRYEMKRVENNPNVDSAWEEIRAELLPLTEGLKHNNIVNYCKDGTLRHEHDEHIEIYILMEFVPGVSLYDITYLRRCETVYGEQRALKESEARHVLQQVGDALTYLHEHDPPIFHLDLNAANIRLNKRRKLEHSEKMLKEELLKGDMNRLGMKVTLIDFGCAAKKSEATQRAQQVSDRSLTHLAPEQISGSGKEITVATEVFLFGELLYFCLLASQPFGSWEDASRIADSEHSFKRKLERGEFIRPANDEFCRWDDLSREARALLEKCLHADPQRRPQSIREVLKDPWFDKKTPDPPGRNRSTSAPKPKPMLPLF